MGVSLEVNHDIQLDTLPLAVDSHDMRLLGQKNSINVRKVLWTCSELGISPQQEDWGGDTRATCTSEFLSMNPKGLVPVLIDGDFVLSESNTICRYLVATKRRFDLLPEDAQARAEVEAWMDWQATELNNAWRAAFMGRVRKDPHYQADDAQEQSVRSWNSAMSLLNDHLTLRGPFVCGDTFTLADIVLSLSTNRWELTPMDRPELSAVNNWMELLSSRIGFVSFCRNGVA